MSTSTGAVEASVRPPGRGSARIAFDRGQHPATLLPLLRADTGDARTCGDCAFLYERRGNHGPRLKCRVRASKRRPGPNLQPAFPACQRFQPAADAAAA
ncbi:hypothetical protein [Streptacidiphilus jiangxiensis]|uniref:Uncharacterized protein n=1 Tax=Streptacidiphilus jiangxiensis TaxID=235985 RepID=A0A1H8BBE9_STRJI|nr:hypothetical protein [Streptacidiphilus jiangxiensis]SEM79749.1 hypothetical protein SAMN05414137_1608 [Streptacidiphilus jiangxiensis]